MTDKILSKNQISLLQSLGKSKFVRDNFYLSGGTALAAFYLKHRYSEDLDFFSEKEFDILNLDVFFKQNKKELGISKIDFEQSYNRNLFFLHFHPEILKTEFTFFPFPRIKKERHIGCFNLEIDSVLDIAVNKLFSIYQRVQARDYIDLYFICRQEGFSIMDLIKKAKIKFDWHIDFIQLGTQFIKAKQAKDYPRMIKKITNNEWINFFVKEAKKFKKEVLK